MVREPVEILKIGKKTVNCDGGADGLGHPRVFLTMAAGRDFVDCPYCGRRYMLDTTSAAGGSDSTTQH